MDIKEKNNKQIRAGILKAMKAGKVTAYRICKDLNISQGNFSRYKKGENVISGKKLSEIMKYLKIQ